MIISRLGERYIVHNYLLPALRNFDLSDHFAAIRFIMHHVMRLLETNDYVRCLFVDFSRAFDTVRHPILIKKLKLLNLPPLVLNWIIHFLSVRTQTIIINGKVSSRLKIIQSIVQGS